MNILFVIDKFPVGGGTETVTRALSNEFVLRGHKVCVCRFTGLESKAFVNEQVGIFNFPQTGCTKNNVEYLNKILNCEHIDIIINQENVVQTGRLCHKAKKGTKVKLISVHHFSLLMNPYSRVGLLAKILPASLVYKLKEYRELRRRNFVYEYSDTVVLLSQRFVEQYKKLQPRKNLNKLYAIANPLENTCKDSPDIEIKNKTVIFVARMQEKEKRPSIALKVWNLLYEKNPEWNLLFLGDGEDLPALKENAKDLPRVEFLGFQNSQPYYDRASILIQTSVRDFEGLPMTLLEAQKHACIPVAMNSYLSLTDIIDNGKNGYITEYENINAMAEKIQILMNDESLRKKLVLNGLESVKKFDIKIIADEWEKLFEKIL